MAAPVVIQGNGSLHILVVTQSDKAYACLRISLCACKRALMCDHNRVPLVCDPALRDTKQTAPSTP